ncbi:MAG TPA: ATP-dependent zinc metalloprotease FtsH [Gammaproteobacteria bacterium]|nr:ATP-dependent zinc metalloprotease FtsH [Gammaproteobacteria bacterium]
MASQGDKSSGNEPSGGFNWRLLIPYLIVMIFLAYWMSTRENAGVESLSYSAFKHQLRQGNVIEVTLQGQEIQGLLKPGTKVAGAQSGGKSQQGNAPAKPQGQNSGQIHSSGNSAHNQSGNGKAGTGNGKTQASGGRNGGKPKGIPFNTIRPPVSDPQLLSLLQSHNVTIHAKTTGGSWWERMLVGTLPWILILGLLFYASYRMQQRMTGGQGGGGPFGVGKSRAKRFRKDSSNTTFDDVAGAENAKRDLHEIIDYLKDPQRYRTLGAKIPKGILLIGQPGTGKTLLAKAVAGEADVPFYSISGSEFIEMFVGVGASRVRDMFENAKREAPAVIFIDEIDSVGRARGTGLGGGHDEREQTLNQILSEMDGFEAHQTVVVLAATNRPDVLDPALLRPGRFDRKVTMELPDRKARRAILAVHSRHVPLADDVDLEKIAGRTVGFAGADLENLVNEAALLAGRERRHTVDMAAFDRARDTIVLGQERDTILSDEEKRLVAYHESGHVLLASLLPHADPPDKVTIIPRGRALGATEQTQEEDRNNIRYSYALDRIGVMLGGRISEQLVFGEVSSGAEADLKQATRLARRMISQWGMNDTLGPVAFRHGEEHVFLGREMGHERDYSEHTARIIDDEVRKLIKGMEEKGEVLLKQHRDRLETLAERLLEKETLGTEEIAQITSGAS